MTDQPLVFFHITKVIVFIMGLRSFLSGNKLLTLSHFFIAMFTSGTVDLELQHYCFYDWMDLYLHVLGLRNISSHLWTIPLEANLFVQVEQHSTHISACLKMLFRLLEGGPWQSERYVSVTTVPFEQKYNYPKPICVNFNSALLASSSHHHLPLSNITYHEQPCSAFRLENDMFGLWSSRLATSRSSSNSIAIVLL